MIKVMDCHDELREIANEVINTFNLAGKPINPTMVVGVTNMLYMARLIDRKFDDIAGRCNKCGATPFPRDLIKGNISFRDWLAKHPCGYQGPDDGQE